MQKHMYVHSRRERKGPTVPIMDEHIVTYIYINPGELCVRTHHKTFHYIVSQEYAFHLQVSQWLANCKIYSNIYF